MTMLMGSTARRATGRGGARAGKRSREEGAKQGRAGSRLRRGKTWQGRAEVAKGQIAGGAFVALKDNTRQCERGGCGKDGVRGLEDGRLGGWKRGALGVGNYSVRKGLPLGAGRTHQQRR